MFYMYYFVAAGVDPGRRIEAQRRAPLPYGRKIEPSSLT